MKRTVLSLMVALLMMVTTFVPFTKAFAALGAEWVVIVGLVGFNKTTESVEIVWVPGPSQAKPQGPGPIGDIIVYRYVVNNFGDPTCTQTIQASVETTPGLNFMTVATSNNHLVVNGKEVGDELDHNCFDNADRLTIAVGVPGPPDSDPTVLPAGFPIPKFVMANVVGTDGQTHASEKFSPSVADGYWLLLAPLH